MKKYLTIIFAICSAFILQAQSVNLDDPSPQVSPNISSLSPALPNNMEIPQRSVPQNINANQAPQEPQPDPEKFASYFPEIEGYTDKIRIPFWKEYWYIIFSAVVASLLVIAIILKPKHKPIISPQERATQRIELARKNSKNLSEKLYALEISQAVRDYIEDKHVLPAPERTTQEFLKLATQSDIFSDETRLLLGEILNLSDMAKFAKHSFKESGREELAETSLKFIESDNAESDKNKSKNESEQDSDSEKKTHR